MFFWGDALLHPPHFCRVVFPMATTTKLEFSKAQAFAIRHRLIFTTNPKGEDSEDKFDGSRTCFCEKPNTSHPRKKKILLSIEFWLVF